MCLSSKILIIFLAGSVFWPAPTASLTRTVPEGLAPYLQNEYARIAALYARKYGEPLSAQDYASIQAWLEANREAARQKRFVDADGNINPIAFVLSMGPERKLGAKQLLLVLDVARPMLEKIHADNLLWIKTEKTKLAKLQVLAAKAGLQPPDQDILASVDVFSAKSANLIVLLKTVMDDLRALDLGRSVRKQYPRQVLGNLIKKALSEAGENDVDIIFENGTENMKVRWDEDFIKGFIAELLLNARAYYPEGAKDQLVCRIKVKLVNGAVKIMGFDNNPMFEDIDKKSRDKSNRRAKMQDALYEANTQEPDAASPPWHKSGGTGLATFAGWLKTFLWFHSEAGVNFSDPDKPGKVEEEFGAQGKYVYMILPADFGKAEFTPTKALNIIYAQIHTLKGYLGMSSHIEEYWARQFCEEVNDEAALIAGLERASGVKNEQGLDLSDFTEELVRNHDFTSERLASRLEKVDIDVRERRILTALYAQALTSEAYFALQVPESNEANSEHWRLQADITRMAVIFISLLNLVDDELYLYWLIAHFDEFYRIKGEMEQAA